MTEVVDRVSDDAAGPADEQEASSTEERVAEKARRTRRRRPREPIALPHADAALMAALLTAAGIVHVVMGPSHMDSSALEGWGFLLSGWMQLGLAVGLVLAARRWMLVAGVVANLGLIGIWLLSRAEGLPIGEHKNHPASVSWVDGSVVAFEILVVGLALLTLLRPGISIVKGRLLALGAPLAVLAFATASLATPEARNHAAASHGDHAAADADGHGSGHEMESADDKGLSALRNGHPHGSGQEELDPRTQAELATQLAGTAELIRRYPNIAAAEAAGYTRQGPFIPGQGTHYRSNPVGVPAVDFDPVANILQPLLIFDGTDPDSPLAGFMYVVISEEVPEGFAGPNDHWHYHEHVCAVFHPGGRVDAPFGFDDESVTEEMCTDIGGTWLEDVTSHMLHVWTVPGYESPDGVFSEINPAITCPDGTYYQIPMAEFGKKESACRNP